MADTFGVDGPWVERRDEEFARTWARGEVVMIVFWRRDAEGYV